MLNNKGFILIELVIVIGTISILAFLVVPKYVDYSDLAKERVVESDARVIQGVVAVYYANNQAFPKILEDLEAYLDVNGLKNRYKDIDFDANTGKVTLVVDE
ncbi:hypothetical protein RH915_01345 [Serpentinicella sp. ANB-PHB4]|uniref:competence type IV pilus major pilin ComGC n=1 Tax=Serpentinicella sp. ANB-PHB4 TaxID=3074076 RepID=UPI002867620B|nr:hypothetical protein [Serpentinicella sp. ANB-PHB4]MDR5658124.1 hypothetical protein [Serpentinicella sp. ANB-PHB4]